MRKLFIVANWKANFTTFEARKWFEEIQDSNLEIKNDNKEIIICPSFTLLAYAKHNIQVLDLSWKVGAQDISEFSQGAHTGETNGKQIRELADYVIIGHSERRQNFNEDEEILLKKINHAKANGLKVIFCVQGKETIIPEGVEIAAYEPIDAIGTGHPDTPEKANDLAGYFKANFKIKAVLYGGSVTSENVNNFTDMQNIDGVLVGKASLNPL